MGVILIILSFILTKKIISPIMALLVNAGSVRKNYLNQNIPISLGLVLFFGSVSSFFLYSLLMQDKRVILILLVLTMTLLVGFIDDLLGDHSVKGLKGHLKKLLLRRELTSGALKAIFISLISFFVVIYYWENLILLLFNFVILILTTNTFNLLDVRPGRTIKVYLVVCGLILALFPQNNIYLGFIFASVLAYAPFDLKGKGMLGDTGSNFLGMSIALAIIFNFSSYTKVFISILLIILHVYTEKKSLTVLIEKISILRFIDNLGR